MSDRQTKYLFVTGGVVSSLGKGVLAASLGLLLERRGLRVAIQKLDPYLNIDPGTMNPCQHGEVYVLDDGTEADLDLGHYERFCAARLDRRSSTTMGRVYLSVLDRERRGEYLGQTIQVVPHVTDEITRRVRELATPDVDVVITEVGGTVGDIEGQPVLEAIRQLIAAVGPGRAAVCHVTLLPYLLAAGELKTKPTQHSVAELRKAGLRPDFLVCRTDRNAAGVSDDERQKLSRFCDVTPDRVFEVRDRDTVYAVPLALHADGFDRAVCRRLGLPESPPTPTGEPHLGDWQEFVGRHRNRGTLPRVQVALVGKYDHADAYKSLVEAIEHAGLAVGGRADLTLIDAEMLGGDARDRDLLVNFDAVVVPGGFGARGVAGKVHACRAAREAGIPYLGICLGLQVAVIEAARHAGGLGGADSTEFTADATHPVVAMLDSQRGVTQLGGTMRLGVQPARPRPGSRLAAAHARHGLAPGGVIQERHRHRYEVNPAYLDRLAAAGLVVVADNPDSGLVEAMERPDHPWFVGVQYHPEMTSRPTRPHPLFVSFLEAALARANRPTGILAGVTPGTVESLGLRPALPPNLLKRPSPPPQWASSPSPPAHNYKYGVNLDDE